MKPKTLALFLFLLSPYVFGQIPENAISIEDSNFNEYFQNPGNIPVVKGRILNLTADEIKATRISYSLVTPFEEFQVEKSCNLNPDGSFELTLEHAFPYQQIWFRAGELFYAGIYANKDLFIELDAEIIKAHEELKFNGAGVKYSGTDGELNSCLNNHVLFRRKDQLDINRKISALEKDRELDYKIFILKYDSLYSILNQLDSEFIQQNPSDYSWLIINERKSNYYADLSVRHWGKEMSPELIKAISNHKSYLTSNDGVLFYNYLLYYVSDIIRKREVPNSMKGDTLIADRTLKIINLLDSLFTQSRSDLLKLHLTSKDQDENNVMIGVTMNHTKTEWCKNLMLSNYNKSLAKLQSINEILTNLKPLDSADHLGQLVAEMPSGARLYVVDTMNYKILLENLKRENPDKALLIDFWATWCGPCLGEMPYSKRLQDETKDLPVAFVYLCTSAGSDIEQWKRKIAEFEIGGTHIFVNHDIESKLMNLFSAIGFPTYVLIDRKGNYKPGAVSSVSKLDKSRLSELIE